MRTIQNPSLESLLRRLQSVVNCVTLHHLLLQIVRYSVILITATYTFRVIIQLIWCSNFLAPIYTNALAVLLRVH